MAEATTQPQPETLDFGSDIKDIPIVGGEIIAPTAQLVGEKDGKEAKKRGWLAALTSAAYKANESGGVQNIGDIAAEAMKSGNITTDELNKHFLSIGFDAQRLSTLKSGESGGSTIGEPQIKAYLDEMTRQIPKVKEGSLTQAQFQAFITEAKANGVPVDRIKSTLEGQETQVVPAQENNIPQAIFPTVEKPAKNITATEASTSDETTQAYQQQIETFLQIVATDPALQRTIQIFREKTGTKDTDMQILAKMATSMYELVHKSGMTREALVSSLHTTNVDEYIANFDSDNTQRLRDRVASTSKVRPITDKELIDGGQPDQAAGFVWFKGNAARPPNAREVRFYINASPEGTLTVAEKLAKLSDFLDQYGIRLQYKFRKDINEYVRTDTCVSYVYIPEATTPEQQTSSDQWLRLIQENIGRIPQDALRPQSSSFTHQIADGISYAEDTGDSSGKKGESYTSRITKTIAETCGELAGQYDSLTPEAIQAVAARSANKLKQLNYI